MNHLSQITLAILAFLSIMITACSQRDNITAVAADDPEMMAAISNARVMLPQFWQVFNTRGHGESGFALKVKITDGKGTEHFWATDIERRDGKVTGTINNDAEIVSSVKLGDSIEIQEAEITDWLYMNGSGKMVGNYTVKPLFKKMPPADVERLKKIMADP